MIYYNLAIGIFIIICYLAIVYLVNKNNYFTFTDKIIHLMFSIYISFLIKIMIFPIPVNENIIQFNTKNNLGLEHNYIPFINIFKNITDPSLHNLVYNMILGNLIPFIPIGFISCIFIKDYLNKQKIFTIGFIISASKEFLQLFISFLINYNYKGFDIDSIILSFIGYLVGFFVCKLFINKIKEKST